MQINNLKVNFNRQSGKWEVWAPGNVLLEEFRYEKDAILFAQDTHDYLTPMGRKRKYGKEA